MKSLVFFLFFFISILRAEDRHRLVLDQETALKRIAHLESLDIDPALKIGAADLKEVLTNVWGQVLPSIPVSAPDWADQFYENYSTLRFTYLFERSQRDVARYLTEVMTYYPCYVGEGPPNAENNLHILLPGYQYPQSPLLTDQVKEMLKAHSESMTCLEYFIFTVNLTLKLPEIIKGADRISLLQDLKKYFFNLPEKKFALPFPIHTGELGFNGIFGELMILHSMGCGIMPTMYVVRPDCVADGFFYGPISCFWHDLLHSETLHKISYGIFGLGNQLTQLKTRSDIEFAFDFVHEANYDLNVSRQADYLNAIASLIIDYYLYNQPYMTSKKRALVETSFKNILINLSINIRPNAAILLKASSTSVRESNIFIAVSNILVNNPSFYSMSYEHLVMTQDLYEISEANPEKLTYGFSILKTFLLYTGNVLAILMNTHQVFQSYLDGQSLKESIMSFCHLYDPKTVSPNQIETSINRIARTNPWMIEFLERPYVLNITSSA